MKPFGGRPTDQTLPRPVAAPTRPPPAHARCGSVGAASSGALQRQPAGGAWKLTIGRYHHQGPQSAGLHPDVASHSFVTLEGPGGRREAWGFVPARRHDPHTELRDLRAGVPGTVRKEDGPPRGHRVSAQELTLSATQAWAVRTEVARYAHGTRQFRLGVHDCHDFGAAVRRAAGASVGSRGGGRS